MKKLIKAIKEGIKKFNSELNKNQDIEIKLTGQEDNVLDELANEFNEDKVLKLKLFPIDKNNLGIEKEFNFVLKDEDIWKLLALIRDVKNKYKEKQK